MTVSPEPEPSGSERPARIINLSEVRAAAEDPVLARLRDLGEPAGRRPQGRGHDDDITVGHDADDDGASPLLDRLGSALPEPHPALRVLVAVLAVAQLAVVLPWLVDHDPFGLLSTSTASHLARDGTVGLAVAAAALLTAWRPRWALPCFLLASVALVAQTLAAVFDSSITSGGGSELVHVPTVALTCLIGLSGIRLTPLGPGARRRS